MNGFIPAHYEIDYRGFCVSTWNIDGFGWVGEVHDAGYNLMPDWMHARHNDAGRYEAVDFMVQRIDEYIVKAQS